MWLSVVIYVSCDAACVANLAYQQIPISTCRHQPLPSPSPQSHVDHLIFTGINNNNNYIYLHTHILYMYIYAVLIMLLVDGNNLHIIDSSFCRRANGEMAHFFTPHSLSSIRPFADMLGIS